MHTWKESYFTVISPPHETQIQGVLLYDLEFYRIPYNLLTITKLSLYLYNHPINCSNFWGKNQGS